MNDLRHVSMLEKPRLPLMPLLGVLALMWSASVYTGFGLSSYPRQEWILELCVAAIFLIPVFNFLKLPGDFSKSVRAIGLALIVHSLWDAAHWGTFPEIQTPIDPRLPKLCPWVDLPVGLWLLVRGR